MRYVGIDVGYGETKVVAHNGFKTKFVSVVGSPADVQVAHLLGDLDKDGRFRVVHDVTKPVYSRIRLDRMVGREALEQSQAHWSTRARLRSEDETFALLAAALLKSGDSGDVALVVGLPVDYYGEAKFLAQKVKGTWAVNGVDFHVRRVACIPQPAGTLYHLGLTRDGRVKDGGMFKDTVAVLDIGTHTTDGVVFRAGRYQQPLGFSIPHGVGQLLEAISHHLAEKYYLEVPPHALNEELRMETAHHAGLRIDLKDVVRDAVAHVGELILSRVETTWGSVLGIRRMILTGGGTYYFHQVVKTRYPYVQTIVEPEWANVLGFRAYATYAFGKGPDA